MEAILRNIGELEKAMPEKDRASRDEEIARGMAKAMRFFRRP